MSVLNLNSKMDHIIISVVDNLVSLKLRIVSFEKLVSNSEICRSHHILYVYITV